MSNPRPNVASLFSRLLAASLFLFGAGGTISFASSDKTPPDAREIARNATVYIESELSLSTRDWTGIPKELATQLRRRPSETTSGTGFLISAGGYIVTNAHVVSGMTILYQSDGTNWRGAQIAEQANSPAKAPDPKKQEDPFTLRYEVSSIKVVLHSGEQGEKTYFPSICKIDRNNDLAILRIRDRANFPFLEPSTESTLPAGTPVLMAGFPGGKLPDLAPFANEDNIAELKNRNPRVSINSGTITALREYEGIRRYQLDVRANHGNSGGPVTNSEGRVIGILYAGIDTMQSINYAIPISYLQKVVPEELRGTFQSVGNTGNDDNEDDSDSQFIDDELKSGRIVFRDK